MHDKATEAANKCDAGVFTNPRTLRLTTFGTARDVTFEIGSVEEANVPNVFRSLPALSVKAESLEPTIGA